MSVALFCDWAPPDGRLSQYIKQWSKNENFPEWACTEDELFHVLFRLFYKYEFFYLMGYKGSEVCILFTQHWVLQERLLPTVQVQKSAEFKTSLKTVLSSEHLLLRDSRD